MTLTDLIPYVSVGAIIGGGLLRLTQWAYKRVRDAEIERNFVRDVATNHLPHMYHVLGLICEKLDIEVTEPPQIGFIDLEGKDEGDKASNR